MKVVAVFLLAAMPGISAADEPALLACRSIGDDAQRLACYDAAAARISASAGVAAHTSSPAPAAAPAVAAATAVAPQPVAPESLFGLEQGRSNALLRSASGIAEVKELEAGIDNVRRAADGNLVLTLDNGQVWQQVDGQNWSVARGNTVRIRPAALGSFLMNREPDKRSIRVRRIR